jgi:hypothetical protein
MRPARRFAAGTPWPSGRSLASGQPDVCCPPAPHPWRAHRRGGLALSPRSWAPTGCAHTTHAQHSHRAGTLRKHSRRADRTTAAQRRRGTMHTLRVLLRGQRVQRERHRARVGARLLHEPRRQAAHRHRRAAHAPARQGVRRTARRLIGGPHGPSGVDWRAHATLTMLDCDSTLTTPPTEAPVCEAPGCGRKLSAIQRRRRARACSAACRRSAHRARERARFEEAIAALEVDFARRIAALRAQLARLG